MMDQLVSLRQGQKWLQERLDNFEGRMAHMEARVHELFCQPCGNGLDDMNCGNLTS